MKGATSHAREEWLNEHTPDERVIILLYEMLDRCQWHCGTCPDCLRDAEDDHDSDCLLAEYLKNFDCYKVPRTIEEPQR